MKQREDRRKRGGDMRMSKSGRTFHFLVSSTFSIRNYQVQGIQLRVLSLVMFLNPVIGVVHIWITTFLAHWSLVRGRREGQLMVRSTGTGQQEEGNDSFSAGRTKCRSPM